MPDAPRMIYWDSCIFLDYIEGVVARMPILNSLLEEASTTDGLVIVTSTLSVAEVAFAQIERTDRTLDPVVEANIDALWADRSAIQLIELDEIVARDARGPMRRSTEIGRHPRPPDAIHLATAQRWRVVDFHTRDDRLMHWNDLGFPVREPWTAKPKLL